MSEKRLEREAQTIEAMIRIYCRGHHDNGLCLCESCTELRDYALLRLEQCPFQGRKPTCANCPIHCYRTNMRQQVRQVMRYAGPRMLWRHPVLAIMHLLDGMREAPALGKPRQTDEQ